MELLLKVITKGSFVGKKVNQSQKDRTEAFTPHFRSKGNK